MHEPENAHRKAEFPHVAGQRPSRRRCCFTHHGSTIVPEQTDNGFYYYRYRPVVLVPGTSTYECRAASSYRRCWQPVPLPVVLINRKPVVCWVLFIGWEHSGRHPERGKSAESRFFCWALLNENGELVTDFGAENGGDRPEPMVCAREVRRKVRQNKCVSATCDALADGCWSSSSGRGQVDLSLVR